MNKKEKQLPNPESRRNFIKNSLLSGLFFASGLSAISCNDSSSEKKDPDALLTFGSLNTDKDWLKVRDLFDLDGRCFLNNASIGPSSKLVHNKTIETMKKLNREIATGHKKIAEVRSKISDFLNVDNSEIAITRNTTEGMNIIANSLSFQKGDEVIITSDEHIGGAAPWLALKERLGIIIKVVQIGRNNSDRLKSLKEAISSKTKVISVSHILCTTGEILPIKEIIKICEEKRIISCIDGAQALGMIPIDLSEINPDFYTTCGHKWLFGPEGTGILFINKRILPSCRSHYVGAYSDSQFNLRTETFELKESASRMDYGTRNTPLILGLGEAIDLANNIGIKMISKRGKALADYFVQKIDTIPEIDILTSLRQSSYYSIITIRMRDKDNLKIAYDLGQKKSIFI
jgi:selenocysteine lyase/cysteine desulfurase